MQTHSPAMRMPCGCHAVQSGRLMLLEPRCALGRELSAQVQAGGPGRDVLAVQLRVHCGWRAYP